jgi:putative membrane protein
MGKDCGSGSLPHAAWGLVVVFVAAIAWSLVHPVDYATWAFEITPGATGMLVLIAVSRRYRFSTMLYAVAGLHFVILAAGAKYTYADMPAFNWIKDEFGLARNHFDRVGHLFQGITAALLTREILVRRTPLGRGKLTGFLSICVALAFSAFYELVEWWWVVLFYPANGPEWLGMQGDQWDSQCDMFMALCGAILIAVFLSRLHDRSIAEVETSNGERR